MYVVLLASALLAGSLLALQASANLQLTNAVGTPYGASTLQLTVAAVLLVVVAAVGGTLGAVQLVSDVPGWQLLGGLASPLYITSGILLFPRLGALAAVGLFVTGQMFASLGLDLFGLIGVPRTSLTVGTVVGAVAVLAGITVIIRGPRAVVVGSSAGTSAAGTSAAATSAARTLATAASSARTHAAGTSVAVRPMPGASGGANSAVTTTDTRTRPGLTARLGRAGWIVLGIGAGAGLPIQGAVNAQLREGLDAPLTVAVISFTVATIAIALVLIVLLALRATPRPQARPLARMPWWGWLGGASAATYVTATFMLMPEIGAATTVALTVTGQQLASAVIDNYGLFRMPQRTLTSARRLGLVLLIAGSILVQLG